MMFLVFILGLVAGYYIHMLMIRHYIMQIISKDPSFIDKLESLRGSVKKEIDALDEELKIPNLFTEVIGNSIMLYDGVTKNFLCQANNLDELAKNLLTYKRIANAKVSHDNQELYFVDGVVKTTNTNEA